MRTNPLAAGKPEGFDLRSIIENARDTRFDRGNWSNSKRNSMRTSSSKIKVEFQNKQSFAAPKNGALGPQAAGVFESEPTDGEQKSVGPAKAGQRKGKIPKNERRFHAMVAKRNTDEGGDATAAAEPSEKIASERVTCTDEEDREDGEVDSGAESSVYDVKPPPKQPAEETLPSDKRGEEIGEGPHTGKEEGTSPDRRERTPTGGDENHRQAAASQARTGDRLLSSSHEQRKGAEAGHGSPREQGQDESPRFQSRREANLRSDSRGPHIDSYRDGYERDDTNRRDGYDNGRNNGKDDPNRYREGKRSDYRNRSGESFHPSQGKNDFREEYYSGRGEYRRDEYRRDEYRRGDYRRDDYPRDDYPRDKYRRDEYRRDEYRREDYRERYQGDRREDYGEYRSGHREDSDHRDDYRDTGRDREGRPADRHSRHRDHRREMHGVDHRGNHSDNYSSRKRSRDYGEDNRGSMRREGGDDSQWSREGGERDSRRYRSSSRGRDEDDGRSSPPYPARRHSLSRKGSFESAHTRERRRDKYERDDSLDYRRGGSRDSSRGHPGHSRDSKRHSRRREDSPYTRTTDGSRDRPSPGRRDRHRSESSSARDRHEGYYSRSRYSEKGVREEERKKEFEALEAKKEEARKKELEEQARLQYEKEIAGLFAQMKARFESLKPKIENGVNRAEQEEISIVDADMFIQKDRFRAVAESITWKGNIAGNDKGSEQIPAVALDARSLRTKLPEGSPRRKSDECWGKTELPAELGMEFRCRFEVAENKYTQAKCSPYGVYCFMPDLDSEEFTRTHYEEFTELVRSLREKERCAVVEYTAHDNATHSAYFVPPGLKCEALLSLPTEKLPICPNATLLAFVVPKDAASLNRSTTSLL
ncbi:hypothetical protein NDN08_000246 [Rhodosorus marinus]|uniref:Spen paralogue and orthologue SPOC C-terminal domain-containing protein n=1 Tax=Rhodosorus marinus TaxID=101924 RepID=A0AAV8UEM7_9RHOD|nr:hypothetical protein NDN08_000246 [Rhodosorus marinus]